MEGFWETLKDGLILLLKVAAFLFVLDSLFYVFGAPVAIPFVRHYVLLVFSLSSLFKGFRF